MARIVVGGGGCYPLRDAYRGRTAPLPPAITLQFPGYTWEVQRGGGPGPNHWSAQNVWVDAPQA